MVDVTSGDFRSRAERLIRKEGGGGREDKEKVGGGGIRVKGEREERKRVEKKERKGEGGGDRNQNLQGLPYAVASYPLTAIHGNNAPREQWRTTKVYTLTGGRTVVLQ